MAGPSQGYALFLLSCQSLILDLPEADQRNRFRTIIKGRIIAPRRRSPLSPNMGRR